MQEQFKDRDPL